uniref:Uncharacterized protein n=1 Tax=Trichuris muris TaxID=70415 RepID=A0A5S6QTZ7_TRIMR
MSAKRNSLKPSTKFVPADEIELLNRGLKDKFGYRRKQVDRPLTANEMSPVKEIETRIDDSADTEIIAKVTNESQPESDDIKEARTETKKPDETEPAMRND